MDGESFARKLAEAGLPSGVEGSPDAWGGETVDVVTASFHHGGFEYFGRLRIRPSEESEWSLEVRRTGDQGSHPRVAVYPGGSAIRWASAVALTGHAIPLPFFENLLSVKRELDLLVG